MIKESLTQMPKEENANIHLFTTININMVVMVVLNLIHLQDKPTIMPIYMDGVPLKLMKKIMLISMDIAMKMKVSKIKWLKKKLIQMLEITI